jgi:hypothetical protein
MVQGYQCSKSRQRGTGHVARRTPHAARRTTIAKRDLDAMGKIWGRACLLATPLDALLRSLSDLTVRSRTARERESWAGTAFLIPSLRADDARERSMSPTFFAVRLRTSATAERAWGGLFEMRRPSIPTALGCLPACARLSASPSPEIKL